jgi:coenzyme F420-0:L-glutamate ligase/coenzyme F420-1:gamma-L-glutamate ligase
MAHRILALALPPLPEIRPGDDLTALIADAWRLAVAEEPELAPSAGDVLVVTQKIVSKAEGAIVDLRTVTPRPEAIAFAERWDRDPRQVEVVLREASAIVRMERGVLITRTRHGFVCANGGVDASNVAPDTVTVLPMDPDRSARAIREGLGRLLDLTPERLPAVVISDSFGRPWRWGIVDVALGVAGFGPLDDQRGRPDTGGRVMRSTIVAVADEIASAAELASGKTSGRPVVLVRGATLPPALNAAGDEASISGDVVMPRESDLFP